jgi:hypothetical protein
MLRVSSREWALVWALALVSRLPGIWLMPNADGDAYTYAEVVGTMSAKLSAGSFGFADLFGFWLPLYPFVSALLATGLHLPPLVAAKLVSACAGAASLTLVFAITLDLTRDRLHAWAGFTLFLLTPLHLFLSNLSLTDIPHVFLILASLHVMVRGHWIAASMWAALAGLMRVESWILLALLPALQLLRERRISLAAAGILCVPPLLWLAISAAATGSPFAYFSGRSRYIEAYLEFAPDRRGFAPGPVIRDLQCFLAGAQTVVFALALAGSLWVAARVSRAWRNKQAVDSLFPPFAAAGLFIAFLAFLFIAYLSRSQPVLWVRYGMLYSALGIPIAVWTIREASFVLAFRPHQRLVLAIAITVWLLHAWLQGTAVVPAIRHHDIHRRIAGELCARIENERKNSGGADARRMLVFCDDPAVRVLSGLPIDQFVRSDGSEFTLPFDEFLRVRNVRFLVVAQMENSIPCKHCPELFQDERLPTFTLLAHAQSPNHYASDLWLFAVEAPAH